MSGSLISLAEHVSGQEKLAQQAVGNRLLRAMSVDDFALLLPHLHRVPIVNGDRLAESGAPIERMCFPEGGIAGFLDVLEDGRRVAVGLLGRDGFAGWPLLLGHDRWPHEVIARGADATAIAIEAGPLHDALAASESLQRLLLRYTASFVMQVTSALVSNLVQSVEQRTARWLLMYHDRIDGDELSVTHEELSAMLGVRRSSITDALHQIEGEGRIRGFRGRIQIRDRRALRDLAGDTYGRAEAEYDRTIGQPMFG